MNLCTYVMIFVKMGLSIRVNYVRYVKLRIDIPEDGPSIDRNMYYIQVKALNYYIEFKLCQTEHTNTDTGASCLDIPAV